MQAIKFVFKRLALFGRYFSGLQLGFELSHFYIHFACGIIHIVFKPLVLILARYGPFA